MVQIGLVIVIIFVLIKMIKEKNTDSTKIFDLETFRFELGRSESSNNYKIVNGVGALGRYQFMPSTISDIAINILKIPIPNEGQFLNNPQLQDRFFDANVNRIKSFMQENLSGFLGKKITGKKNGIVTTINIYGLIAGAWLGGMGGVQNLLRSGLDKSDGQTYISDYIAKFSLRFN